MTDISDLSNNQDNFIQLLADYINISNSNSNPVPLSNNYCF